MGKQAKTRSNQIIQMRQKQINKLLAIRVPKILETLTKPYQQSVNPKSPFVYNEPEPIASPRSTTTKDNEKVIKASETITSPRQDD